MTSSETEFGKLTVQTAPTVLPVSVAECKAVLRIDHAQHDTMVQSLIKAARAYVETVGRLTLTDTTYDLRLDTFPSGPIDLRRGPVQSVTSITYTDAEGAAQTLSASTYNVDIYSLPERIWPEDTWPATECEAPNDVKVRYLAGYGDSADDIPESIRQALIAIVVHMYENPAAHTELVNGLHPNPMFDALVWSFRRAVL